MFNKNFSLKKIWIFSIIISVIFAMFNKSDISASITAITILYTIVFLFVKVWKNIVKPAINKIHTVASNKGFVSSKHINSVVTASIDRKTEANHSDVVTDSFDSSYESFDFETANDIPHVSLNSMYVKTILLNQYKKPKYIHNSNSQYSGWVYENLRILDIRDRYIQLLNEGYLEQASDKERLMKLLKVDLEQISENMGLSKSGNKIDLVIRIINSNDYEKYVLHIIGSAPEYVVSDKGKMWLKQHEDLLQLSQNYQLDPNRYVEIRNELTQKLESIQFENIAVIQTQEIIKEKLNNQQFEGTIHLFFQLVRYHRTLDNRGHILNNLLLAFIFQLSCLGHYGNINKPEDIQHYLNQYSLIADFTENEINSHFEHLTRNLELPYQKFPFPVMNKLITDYRTSGSFDFARYKRFANKAPFITEYGEYWKDPYSMYSM